MMKTRYEFNNNLILKITFNKKLYFNVRKILEMHPMTAS